jgi:hypothetical protein
MKNNQTTPNMKWRGIWSLAELPFTLKTLSVSNETLAIGLLVVPQNYLMAFVIMSLKLAETNYSMAFKAISTRRIKTGVDNWFSEAG